VPFPEKSLVHNLHVIIYRLHLYSLRSGWVYVYAMPFPAVSEIVMSCFWTNSLNRIGMKLSGKLIGLNLLSNMIQRAQHQYVHVTAIRKYMIEQPHTLQLTTVSTKCSLNTTEYATSKRRYKTNCMNCCNYPNDIIIQPSKSYSCFNPFFTTGILIY
jgi:hypothetical protein